MWKFQVLFLCIQLTGFSKCDDMKDVREGENVVLECRFSSILATRDPTFYWIRTNPRDKDNVAIGDTPLEKNYRVEYRPNEGRYDLTILNASYERDHGRFQCRGKEGGTGNELHSKIFQLTVLLPPDPPKITPTAPSGTEGKTTELACSSIGGSPDPMIRWYKKGEAHPLDSVMKGGGSRRNATSAVLSITPQRDQDGSEYRCVVWNRALPEGRKLETTVALNVNYYPRVKVGPENPIRVETGRPARMVCNVDSKPAVSNVKWARNGRFLATDFTFTLPRVSLQDSGTYICSADNGLGQIGEAEMALDVLYGPVVGLEQRRIAEEGENVFIRCNVSSNPRPVKIEWIRPGDPGFRQTGDTLKLERVSATQAGSYVCRATNLLSPTAGGVSVERSGNATVEIVIRHAPGRARITPDRPIGVEGSSVTLTCSADPPGWPLPEYRWWRQGSETSIAVGAQFTITRAALSSEGAYVCQPSNELGVGAQVSVSLRVHQPPRVISQLQSQVVRRAGDHNFSATCSAVGKPKPTIRWQKDNVDIESGSLYNVQTEESDGRAGTFTVQSTLRFLGSDRLPLSTQLMPMDRGRYTCLFENDVKKETTSMFLRIEHSPFVLHQHNKVAFDVGEPAMIICRMQAFPQPNFEWSSANAPVLPTSGSRQHSYAINVTTLINDVYQSALKIATLKENDYGDYVCKATNTMGSQKTLIKLQPKGPPEKPTNIRTVGTWVDRVRLEWTEGFDGGVKDLSYIVEYFKQSGGRGAREFDCQQFNPCNITGLEQQQTYTFRVKATSYKGTSPFSENITTSTRLDSTRIPSPEQVAFEPVSRTLVFNVPPSRIDLRAHIQIRPEEGPEITTIDEEAAWQPYESLVISSNKLQKVLGNGHQDLPPFAVRVQLCLDANDAICGPFAEATFVKELPLQAPAGIQLPYLIIIIVVGVLLVIGSSLLVVCCCCRKDKKQTKKKKKDYEMEGANTRPNIVAQQPPPPYYPRGMENKALESSMDVSLDEGKNPTAVAYGNGQNGYGYHNGAPHGAVMVNGHVPNGGVNMGYLENSYSNSNNGGSVNSQDSLWQVKANAEAAGVAHERSAYAYDPITHGGYGGFEEYSHHRQPYPTNDDYHMGPQATQEYDAAGADGYAAVHKPKKRIQGHLDSPYHDVSGLPDPYMDHDDEPSNKVQQHISVSFDESLESGYSTPNSRNRRIIREIIV